MLLSIEDIFKKRRTNDKFSFLPYKIRFSCFHKHEKPLKTAAFLKMINFTVYKPYRDEDLFYERIYLREERAFDYAFFEQYRAYRVCDYHGSGDRSYGDPGYCFVA